MFYYTHYGDMDAPQYVHVDESSDGEFPQIFYYKHHRYMYVPHSVSPDAVS